MQLTVDAFPANAGGILLHLLQGMGGKGYEKEDGVIVRRFPQCTKCQGLCMGFLCFYRAVFLV